MALDWISIIKNIPELVSSLGGLIKNNRATKDLLIRELKLNIKAFETAFKNNTIQYDKLIDLLKNDTIKQARKDRFQFSSIKSGEISKNHIKDPRNSKYLGKDCSWLFKNIDEKIEDLRQQKDYHGTLHSIEKTNIKLQFSNLFYKMKLLAEFIQ